MPNTPEVTVLMTVYNGMPYLRQAMESVLSQTFSLFEFLIVDDASKDDSVSCIKSYDDPRIRLVCNEQNRGQSYSLNRGLALARGRYIARLDQDDVCLPERLKKQVAFLDRRLDVSVAGTLMLGIDMHGRRMGLLGRNVENYGAFVAFLLLGICPVCHPSVMFRRDIVTSAGGYDESFAPAEDVDLWSRLAMQRYNAYVILEPLTLHRFHKRQQSVMKNATQRSVIRKVQERWVGTFCPPEDARGVYLLLSMSSVLWKEYSSKVRLKAVFHAFNVMLTNVEMTLKISSQERAVFRRVLTRQLGGGIRLAQYIERWPSVIFYPAVWLSSPLLIPNVRPVLSWCAQSIRRWRYPMMLKGV